MSIVGNDLKIEVVGRICYPHGFVFCSAPPALSTVVRDPLVIFEVLSENHEYAATPSVQRYVILSQVEVAILRS
jgi:hypothetical protein